MGLCFITSIGLFCKNWEACGRLSDCEKFVGVILTGDDVVGLGALGMCSGFFRAVNTTN